MARTRQRGRFAILGESVGGQPLARVAAEHFGPKSSEPGTQRRLAEQLLEPCIILAAVHRACPEGEGGRPPGVEPIPGLARSRF